MRRPVPQLAASILLVLPAVAQPSREQTEALLAGIDAAFNAADLQRLERYFHPTHASLTKQRRARMNAAMSFDTKLHRKSEIVRFDQRHGRAIALVRCTTGCEGMRCLQYVEHNYLVAGTKADGVVRAEVMVPVNDGALAAVRRGLQQFSCPACNYTFGGSSRWLAVPARPDQTGCMESLTFLALGQDLVVEVSVHVLSEALPAKEALLEFLDSMRQLPWLKIPEKVQVRSWVPPAYAGGKAPRHLDAARCRVALQEGKCADIHLATFGPIRYLMVVQGNDSLLESQAAGIRELLAGFRLLDSKKAPNEICQLALSAHGGGGCISGSSYQNPVHNLKLTAPEGWRGAAYASRHLFHVRFQCQGGAGSLHVQAMAPPVGYTVWTEDKANELFARACADRELDTPSDATWTKGARGFQWRQVRSKDPQAPRILRLVIRRAVLVLMEGVARDRVVLEDIHKAMGTLALLQQPGKRPR